MQAGKTGGWRSWWGRCWQERNLSFLLWDAVWVCYGGRGCFQGGTRVAVGGARVELWGQACGLGLHSGGLCSIGCLGPVLFQLHKRSSNRWKLSGARRGIIHLTGGSLTRSQVLEVGPREELGPRTGRSSRTPPGSPVWIIFPRKNIFAVPWKLELIVGRKRRGFSYLLKFFL